MERWIICGKQKAINEFMRKHKIRRDRVIMIRHQDDFYKIRGTDGAFNRVNVHGWPAILRTEYQEEFEALLKSRPIQITLVSYE